MGGLPVGLDGLRRSEHLVQEDAAGIVRGLQHVEAVVAGLGPGAFVVVYGGREELREMFGFYMDGDDVHNHEAIPVGG